MDQGPLDRIRTVHSPDNRDVMALAVKALSVLATRQRKRPVRSLDANVRELCDACVHPEESQRHAAVAQLIASGVPSAEIADRYVPLAARLLGEAWVDDTLSFSEVTIGAARLQEIVRAFGRNLGGSVTIPLGHRVLMVIPPDEDHTLGAFVAANQFRRYGLWVHLAIGQSVGEIAETVRTQNFDMIGISGAGLRALESVRHLVETVKESCPTSAPVVVGGNVCNVDMHVQEFTGADFVTTSPRQALGFCGLSVNPEAAFAGSVRCAG